jgi:hypothetical protein
LEPQLNCYCAAVSPHAARIDRAGAVCLELKLHFPLEEQVKEDLLNFQRGFTENER